jgi:peroxiredoxin Q/BCP
MTLKTGMIAPDFTASADSDETVTLSDYQGQTVVLYFYPRDNTPGCTKQACGFRDALSGFKKLNAAVIGISKDTPAKHDKFKAKYDLTFPLVSDEDGSICDAYGTWIEKSLYGKKYMGIERSTFLIDTDGVISHIWRGVKVKNHIEDVYKTLQDAE